MQTLGFHSVFARLFASVMLALILFAVAMVLLTQLVHDKDSGIRSEVVATQILGQIDPFLHELNTSVSNNNRLQSRFMLAVVKKSFDIFDESLQAKMGLYDNEGNLLMQTDNSDFPVNLPALPSLFSRVFPSLADTPPTQQAQVYSSTGYTLLYESRLPPKKPVLSAALNLFTGTLLLLLIMAGVLWWIARSMTWRINQMSRQMTQLGDGDFTVRVNARGNDEIALLARGFNQAAQKIEHLVNANNLLLAHASHELRTPITRIRLQIEMMDMLAGAMPEDTKAKFDKRAQAINRDLSGLNDLVESILLVSRLDAGHVLQQIERMDIYDLVNQERQHYPEATLLGERLVIEGQPLMLTHLIRNLLNNAMLHGEPPITILLYGVENKTDAVIVPEYLLQTAVCHSFATADNNAALLTHEAHIPVDKQKQLSNISASVSSETDSSDKTNKTKSGDTVPLLPAPTLYKNGHLFTVEEPLCSLTASNDDQSDLVESPITEIVPLINTNAVIGNYNKFTTDLVDRIKKGNWRMVAEPKLAENTIADANLAQTKRVETKLAQNKLAQNKLSNAEQNNTAPNKNANDAQENQPPATQRKENLFKKHLKKVKPEPVRPQPNYVVLAVIDEGGGIPEDKREEIFSPFVRLQQKKKGSGLGLSLVTQIVTAHQGHITTDTINGHTRFLIVLPVKHDPHYNYRDHNRRG
ncbi:sensor histidine kinase [Psychrobacter sp. 16-MNA-CIBAN-0192]|uniref:sensor histidine kinase n=1 Tax=Psychrobacter sp. 16-MNA-CIBAN-0192 TaxID=3140448 RepID=UPI0033340379